MSWGQTYEIVCGDCDNDPDGLGGFVVYCPKCYKLNTPNVPIWLLRQLWKRLTVSNLRRLWKWLTVSNLRRLWKRLTA